MYKPLEGVKIIDLTLAGAGPSCTKILTEYGADTIWVEPLCGTSTRYVHKVDFYANGKRAIALNLKAPEGMAVMHRLLENADVLVSNYRPKAIRKLGLDYDSLHGRYPKLIHATLSGFGESGPEADNPGYDPVAFWAKGGMLIDFAEQGSLVVPPIAVGDIATGQALAGGVCAALFHRERSGEGSNVFISLLAQAVYLNHDAIIESQYGEKYPKSRLAPRRSLLNTYRCKDNKWITIAIASDFDRYFQKLMKAIGRTDLLGHPGWNRIEDTMYDKAPEMVAILDEAFSSMTQSEAVAALKAIDAPVSKVQSTAEMMQDSQVWENNYLFHITASDGKDLTIPANPVKFTDKNCGVTGFRRAPRLGEHTVEVLREYGYSDREIQSLLQNGIAANV